MSKKDDNYWKPIDTAPKTGEVIILTWMEDGLAQEEWPCRWDPTATNGFFPDDVGMWVAPNGSYTWNHRDSTGAPTHWRPNYKN